MNKYFVSQEQAIKLNKLGFDESSLKKTVHKKECSCKINGSCPLPNIHCQYPDCEIDKSIAPVGVPLYAQAFAWFRDKHKLVVNQERDGGWWIFTIKNLYDEDDQGAIDVEDGSILDDPYEDTESKCLDRLIELLEINFDFYKNY